MWSRVPVVLVCLFALFGVGPETGRRIQATPTVQDGEPGSLAAMLGRVPEVPSTDADPTFPLAAYADVAGQFSALGEAAPASPDDHSAVDLWWHVVPGLAMPGVPNSTGVLPDWRETFGFDWLQVDQVLEVDLARPQILLLRGRFAAEELRAAWAGSGYRPVDIAGVSVASFSAEPEIDFNHPVGRLGVGVLNNAAILADGTLVFTSSLAMMEEVIAASAGRAPSLAERTDVATLLSHAPALVSTLLLDGEALRAVPAEQLAEFGMAEVATAVAGTGTMPPVELALVGVTAGGPIWLSPDPAATPLAADTPARFEIVLLMADQAAAEAAVPVVRERLATLPSLVYFPTPYAELFVDPRLTVVPEAPILLVDLGFGAASLFSWYQSVNARDLVFVAW